MYVCVVAAHKLFYNTYKAFAFSVWNADSDIDTVTDLNSIRYVL